MAQTSSIKLTPTKIQQIMESGRRQLSTEEFEELSSLLFDLEIYGLTPWINTQLGRLMAKIEWELEVGESPEWAEALQACDRAFLGRELRDMCEEVGASPIGHKKQLCARLYKRQVPEAVAVMEPYLKAMTPERIKQEIERYAQTEVKVIRTTTEEAAGQAFRLKQRGWTGFGRYSSSKAAIEASKALGKAVDITLVESRGACDLYIRDKTSARLPQTEHLYVEKVRKVKDRLEELHRANPDEFYRRKKLIEQSIKEREKGYQRAMPELTLEELRDVLKFTDRLYR